MEHTPATPTATPAPALAPAPQQQPQAGGQYVWRDGQLVKVGETKPAQGRRVQPGGVQTPESTTKEA